MQKKLDRHALYLASVQDPISEVERISSVYEELFHRPALSLREDFAGTFALSCCWVQSSQKRKAIAIELDSTILQYGVDNYWQNLSDEQKLQLVFRHDSSISASDRVDICAAFNFSYCLLHTRKELLDYFRYVHQSLNDQGILMLDAFGGSESEIENIEERVIDNNDYLAPFNFEFVLDKFNPVNRMANYHINFRYHHGESLEKAFQYHFRMWTLPELKDVLLDAGFSDVKIYWEDCDDNGFGNGEFYFTETEENTVHWNAYVIGMK